MEIFSFKRKNPTFLVQFFLIGSVFFSLIGDCARGRRRLSTLPFLFCLALFRLVVMWLCTRVSARRQRERENIIVF